MSTTNMSLFVAIAVILGYIIVREHLIQPVGHTNPGATAELPISVVEYNKLPWEEKVRFNKEYYQESPITGYSNAHTRNGLVIERRTTFIT